MIIIGIAIFSTPSILTFLFYRKLRKKGKAYKNAGLITFSLTTVAMLILAIKIITGPSGFGPEYDSIEIEQEIDGKLLCESVYKPSLKQTLSPIRKNHD